MKLEYGQNFHQWLTPEQSQLYNTMVPPHVQQRVEEEYDGLKRWDNLIPESNLDHINGMYETSQRFLRRFPSVQKTLNLVDVAFIIGIHDSPEWGSRDVSAYQLKPSTHGDPIEQENIDAEIHRSKVTKRAQKIFGLHGLSQLVYQYIPDQTWGEKIIEYQRRYERQEDGDAEAHYGKFLDKFQAAEFSLENLYTPRGNNPAMDVSLQINNAAYSLFKAVDTGRKFRRSLGQQHQRACVTLFVRELIQRYAEAGYTELAEYALRDLGGRRELEKSNSHLGNYF